MTTDSSSFFPKYCIFAVVVYCACAADLPLFPSLPSAESTQLPSLDGLDFNALGINDTDVPAATSAPEFSAGYVLLLAVELCRHGDRAPLFEFPKDALPASKWPEGPGGLTAIGQRAHYELGQSLRRRYVDTGFLPWSFSASDVYVRSTSIDRASMSAYSQIAGLYPAGTAAVYDVGAQFGRSSPDANFTGLPNRWQPVPIHTERPDTDSLLIPGANCPRHAKLLSKAYASSEWLEYTSKYDSLRTSLAGIVGMPKPLSLRDVANLEDVWVCFEAHGVPLPAGVTVDMRHRLQKLVNWMLINRVKNPELRRLRAGLLLNEIKQRVVLSAMKARGTLPDHLEPALRKFVLYSAHDTTVLAALSALGISLHENPPYNSTVIWELVHDTKRGQTFVGVSYNGNSQRLPECSEVIDGRNFCPLETYFENTAAMTIPGEDAFRRECQTGLRRAFGSFSWWGKSRSSNALNYGSMDSRDPPVHSSGWMQLLLILALTCVVFFASAKVKSRYNDYSLVSEERLADENGTLQNNVFLRKSDRGILM